MQDLEYAAKEKVNADQEVIDEAIKENAEVRLATFVCNDVWDES